MNISKIYFDNSFNFLEKRVVYMGGPEGGRRAPAAPETGKEQQKEAQKTDVDTPEGRKQIYDKTLTKISELMKRGDDASIAKAENLSKLLTDAQQDEKAGALLHPSVSAGLLMERLIRTAKAENEGGKITVESSMTVLGPDGKPTSITTESEANGIKTESKVTFVRGGQEKPKMFDADAEKVMAKVPDLKKQAADMMASTPTEPALKQRDSAGNIVTEAQNPQVATTKEEPKPSIVSVEPGKEKPST